jgi:hypothetical protein
VILTPVSATSEEECQLLLVDLSKHHLTDLRDIELPEEMERQLREQIYRPRYNLGGNGPPGRVD